MKKILVIDDDVELCNLLKEYFVAEGFDFECAHCCDKGVALFNKYAPDIVILDVMLPGRDGFDILRDIRTRSDTPVIMLTAKGDHIDRVVGLEIGADDYICKPFNTRELVARVRAVLRRSDGIVSNSPEDVIRVGDLEMDLRARSVRVGFDGVSLTSAEFKMLECLLVNAGKLVQLENLSTEVLRRHHTVYDRSISVHMSNLRRKIGPYPTGDERITTIRGEGFIYVFPKAQDKETS